MHAVAGRDGFMRLPTGLQQRASPGNLPRAQLEGAADMDAARLGRRHARLGALADQLPLEFGKNREDTDNHAPVRAGRIDHRTLSRQHPQADPALAQILDQIDQVAQATAQPIQFPDHQNVT